MRNTFGKTGHGFYSFIAHLARILKLSGQSLYWIFIAPFKGKKIRWRLTFIQMERIGVDAVPIVSIITFSVGLIIAMQAAYQLERFGASIYVADLVGVSITRELGPLITAIIIAGRSGSAIAAEIGTMKVAEEIDALKTMALNPIGFLVVPRTLAMIIVVPCLTILADFLGIAGGFSLAVFSLKIPFIAYFNETATAILLKDFLTGLVKSLVFAVIISQIGAYQGFSVSGGAEGVGKSTTASVVSSIFLIIFSDLIFTMIFFSA
ncbi:MAG: MlaE family lipid ABC transporter permease subunit [Actinobacteria bacterium]|nr:MlaE family lipid ABC transporter permease subunit [Actinomycetota bacterium]